MNHRFLTFFASALLACSAAVADSDFTSLEEQMSGEDFRRSGLEKLDPDELLDGTRDETHGRDVRL